ncbi:MAG TPA: CRISPR-associated helicase Cas3' [Kofleriaceae bacterium]|nr:CRISPR-associated helicase Cas3' [Kofleriaceae bacterium]
MSTFEAFFSTATGTEPFPYQLQFAIEPALPDLVVAPTGAGKTATAVLGWLWRRRHHPDERVRAATPRRLVFCLPMRTLVEQTHRVAHGWLERLGLSSEVSLHAMLGGAVDDRWHEHPEREAIIVGTQDQLLSRALNRGYAMSRFKWPVHFALLNNDCLWVLDEVQLMGVGSSTSAQLQGLRDQLGTSAPTASIWMSATLAPGRLRTIDHTAALRPLSVGPADLDRPVLAARHHAHKPLRRLDAGDAADRARQIIETHTEGTLTLVVLNQVKRAQEMYGELAKRARDGIPVRLVHSRFRPADRRAIQDEVLSPGWSGILVATQAIEAGVDISARALFTEVASWSSMVQRFGRCNRRGEHARGEASVCWIDVDDASAAPYQPAELAQSRDRLARLDEVSPAALMTLPADDEAPVTPILRRRDVLELFDTQPDLAGTDLDISRWVRDAEERDVQVAWRALDGVPADDAPEPHRDELCNVPIGELRKLLEGRRAYRWSGAHEEWEEISADRLAPGTALLVPLSAGGYDPSLGWTGRATHVPPAVAIDAVAPDSDAREALSFACDEYVPLAVHASDVAEEAEHLRAAVGGNAPWDEIVRAARWHDLGKAHAVFQEMIVSGLPPGDLRRDGGPWAKSDGRRGARCRRPEFRHELASALAMLQRGEPDLLVYLVAAHHGKVRLSVRPRSREDVPGDGRPFALGVWDGDTLPETDLGGGVTAPAATLDLSVTALGDGPSGPSWLDRMARLLRAHGPFRLAFWETLVRVADWRGTARRRRHAPTEGR